MRSCVDIGGVATKGEEATKMMQLVRALKMASKEEKRQGKKSVVLMREIWCCVFMVRS